MNFKEWVYSELFERPLPIKWSKTPMGDLKGNFTVNNKNYILTMVQGDSYMPWEIKFELIDPISGKKLQNLTGTGDAMQVFSTVIKGIKFFLDKYKPDAFVLTASDREPSRISLYKRLLSMLPKNKWEVDDLDGTFYVQKIGAKPLPGWSDDDFSDYLDD